MRSVALAAALVAGCAASAPEPVAPEPQPPVAVTAAPVAEAAPLTEAEQAIAASLERVAVARGLPIKRPVRGVALDRSEIVGRMRAHVEEDVPPEVVRAQGDGLILLDLAPPDYDLMEGMLALIEGRIAGFYEPKDQTMYLLSDLDEEDAEQTLSHELVHALQDQSYHLAPLLKYHAGQSDRAAAAQALIEGDATSAMFDLAVGSAFKVQNDRFRQMLAAAGAMSEVSRSTPAVLMSALNAPYVDGFALVKALRERGGYDAVDAALADPPSTTEQALHLDKYLGREPAEELPAIPLGALGPGFSVTLDDPMGEQGLRLVLEEWTSRAKATGAAAGWGGDRYVVAERSAPDGAREVALAWHLRMDTVGDAAELAAVVRARLPKPCAERPTLGPIAWSASGRDVILVAGPLRRAGAEVRSASGCAAAKAWLGEIAGAAR